MVDQDIIENLRQQLAAITQKLAEMEAPAGIADDEILAIAGALAAYCGVRVHIRQIRLIGSRAWAQEGRVSIQASHRLHS